MAHRRNSGRRLAQAAAAFGLAALVSWPAAGADNPDAVAVVIGNAEYRNHAWNVPTAAADAQAVAEFAIRRLGFDKDRVFVLDNATGTQLNIWFGTNDFPVGKLHNFVQEDRSDVLVFYAGHGMPDLDSKKGYLLPVDADPARVRLSGYSIELLLKNMKTLPARSVLVALDACFSGLTARSGDRLIPTRGTVNFSLKPVRSARIAVLTAASGLQAAWSDPISGHGVFTEQLLAGLGGAADENRNSEVTLGEIRSWLDSAVPRRVLEAHGADQTPDVQGDSAMVLAALPSDTLTVRAAQAGAQVYVDGSAYRAGMPLGRGRHEVTVEAQGYEPYQGQLDVDGPTEYRIDLCRQVERQRQECHEEEIVRTREDVVEDRSAQSMAMSADGRQILRMRGMSRREISEYDDDHMRKRSIRRSMQRKICSYLDREMRNEWDVESWRETALRGRLRQECRDLGESYAAGSYRHDGGNFRDGDFDQGGVLCDCDIYDVDDECVMIVSWECIDERVVQVPVTVVEPVCRNETVIERECPAQIVERLR